MSYVILMRSPLVLLQTSNSDYGGSRNSVSTRRHTVPTKVCQKGGRVAGVTILTMNMK